VEEGIVPGGGVALLRAMKALDSLKLEGDLKVGVDIVRRAIEEPCRWIVQNAGREGTVVVQNILANKDKNYGFNAQTEEYGDLVKQGVVDPTKVVRTALENAASVSALLLTTEAMVAEKPEPKKPAAPAAGGHHHPHGGF
jgi:chaperonin GroEL